MDKPKRPTSQECIDAIASLPLDMPRNRFGKPDPAAAAYASLADLLRRAGAAGVTFKAGGGRDILDQIIMVARVARGDKQT